jgi:hypothetical protein
MVSNPSVRALGGLKHPPTEYKNEFYIMPHSHIRRACWSEGRLETPFMDLEAAFSQVARAYRLHVNVRVPSPYSRKAL